MGIRIASGDGQLPAEVRQKNEIALTFKKPESCNQGIFEVSEASESDSLAGCKRGF